MFLKMCLLGLYDQTESCSSVPSWFFFRSSCETPGVSLRAFADSPEKATMRMQKNAHKLDAIVEFDSLSPVAKTQACALDSNEYTILLVF